MSTPDACAVIVEDPSKPAPELLDESLERSGFWHQLEAAREASGQSAERFPILIKPELEAFERGSPAATDPLLVAHLIDRLQARGYRRVNVCAGADSSFFWAENRDVMVLADLLGYAFETPEGHPYDVLDLGADQVPNVFGEGSALQGEGLARAWLEAGFRICFASNRTDEREGYALALHSLLGVLPQADKDYYYRYRRAAGDAVAELLRVADVQFTLIDAVVSAHGEGCGRSPRALKTGCIIASASAPLADFAGALKMGLDPYVSPLAARVFGLRGLPPDYTIDGNLAPYPGWQNPDPLLLDSRRRRDLVPAASRLVTPWLQVLDADLFPLQRVLDAKLNPRVSRFFGDTDANPVARTLLMLLNYAIGAGGEWLRAYQVVYDKDGIRRTEAPLGFDPQAFGDADYAAIRPQLDRLATLLRDTATAAEPLRWREIDGATIFRFERELPIPFDDFVATVDVSRTIQYMYDYIGGVVVPTARDEAGRTLRQAERNLYLPQPNYLVLYGGQPIDVSKIEICDYAPTRHRMYWKTIKSENGSASYDDGVVSFLRSERGTRVRILGKQQFTLPPFWQAVNLDLFPALKRTLVDHAYRTFFERTIANLEALVEGRDIRLGRPWYAPRDCFDTEPLPAETLERLAMDLGERLASLLAVGGGDESASRAQVPVSVDAHGFRHFVGAPVAERGVAPLGPALATAADSLGELLRGLAEAVARDGAQTLNGNVP